MLWALSTRERNTAFRVGTGLGVTSLLSSTLINRLRNIEAYRLQRQAMSTFSSVTISNPLRGLAWSPVIEVEHEGAVFTQKSDDYFKSGAYPNKVPVLIGYNSNEAGIAGSLTDALRQYLLLLDIVSNTLAPFSLTSTTQLRNLAANEIRLFYFGVNAIRNQMEQVIKFINTDQFNRPSIRLAKNIAPFVPVYFYVFGYEGDVVGPSDYSGVGHGEDLIYLFRQALTYSAKDQDVRAKLIRLWTNFAKTWNPTPRREALLNNVIWPVVNPNSNDLDYVWLNGTISLDKNPDQEAYQFYETVFNQFGDQSYSTF
jgi:carboxylesterase type B